MVAWIANPSHLLFGHADARIRYGEVYPLLTVFGISANGQ